MKESSPNRELFPKPPKTNEVNTSSKSKSKNTLFAMLLVGSEAIALGGCATPYNMSAIDREDTATVDPITGEAATEALSEADRISAQVIIEKFCPPKHDCIGIFTNTGKGDERAMELAILDKTENEVKVRIAGQGYELLHDAITGTSAAAKRGTFIAIEVPRTNNDKHSNKQEPDSNVNKSKTPEKSLGQGQAKSKLPAFQSKSPPYENKSKVLTQDRKSTEREKSKKTEQQIIYIDPPSQPRQSLIP